MHFLWNAMCMMIFGLHALHSQHLFN
jgi:hypothetical protein